MKQKKLFIASIFSFFLTMPLTAQGLMPAGMKTLADQILDIFTGPFVRIILVIFLCGAAITYAFNKDNEKMKRNCIAIGVAIAILIGASGIVGAIWTAAGG